MPAFVLNWKLGLGLALLEIVALPLLAWLAALLGRRLRPVDLTFALLLPPLVLAPYLVTSRLFVPTAPYADQVPGAARAAAPDAFDLDLNDAALQFLPWELEVRHAFAAGRLPFWSDTLDGGSELWGNLQAQILSPVALAARPFPIQHHLLAAFALKLMVSLLGATLLARAHGVRPAWARISGLTFALGGAIAPWAVFPHSAAVCWAPWAAAGALRLVRRPDRKAAIGTALVTAALLLGGHPEVAAAGVLFAALLSLGLGRWRSRRRVAIAPVPGVAGEGSSPGAWRLLGGRERSWGRGVAAAAGAGLLGALLAAPLWLPFLHLVAGSQRAHEQRSTVAPTGGGLAAYTNYLAGPFHPAPGAAGGELSVNPLSGPRPKWSYYSTGYGGVAALLGLGLLLARPAPRRFSPAALFFLFTLLAVADIFVFERIWKSIPLLSLAENSRFQSVGLLAFSIAAAGGLETMMRRRGGLRRATTLGATAAASLLAGAAGPVLFPWALLAAATGVAPRRPRAAAALVAAATLFDLGAFTWRQLPRGESAHFLPATRFMNRVAEALAAPGGPWRATGQELLVFPSLLPAYGLAELRPHNPLVPQRQVEALDAAFGFHPSTRSYFSPLARLEHPLLDFLGVRVVVTNAYLPAVPGMERIDRGEAEPQPYWLLANPDALPRAFLPHQIDRVARGELARWISALDDPLRVAIDPVEATGLDLASGSGEVRALASAPGRMRLELPAQSREVLLAVSIPGPAGWAARSDRRELRRLTLDGAFLGVAVPAGTTGVELAYRPPGLVAGSLLALTATAVLLALGLAGLRRRSEPH